MVFFIAVLACCWSWRMGEEYSSLRSASDPKFLVFLDIPFLRSPVQHPGELCRWLDAFQGKSTALQVGRLAWRLASFSQSRCRTPGKIYWRCPLAAPMPRERWEHQHSSPRGGLACAANQEQALELAAVLVLIDSSCLFALSEVASGRPVRLTCLPPSWRWASSLLPHFLPVSLTEAAWNFSARWAFKWLSIYLIYHLNLIQGLPFRKKNTEEQSIPFLLWCCLIFSNYIQILVWQL